MDQHKSKDLMSETSVVICNYNYAKFIGDAIESVLDQTVKPRQLIIVDDGSTDNSRTIIDRYSDDSIVKIYQANGGQCAAYNVGLELVEGKYVLFLDSDDRLLPNAIEEVEKKFTDEVSKVHYPLMLINVDGERLGTQIPSVCDSGDVKKIILDGFEYISPPASGNVYRASALKQVFPIPLHPNERYAADFFAIFSVPFFGSVATIHEPLGEYRVHLTKHATIGFGNAGSAIGSQQRNVDILREWLDPILGIRLPKHLLNFSILKMSYAQAALSSKKFSSRVADCWKMLPNILRSLWHRDRMSFSARLALTLWAVVLPIMPRRMATTIAVFVCNPDARKGIRDRFQEWFRKDEVTSTAKSASAP